MSGLTTESWDNMREKLLDGLSSEKKSIVGSLLDNQRREVGLDEVDKVAEALERREYNDLKEIYDELPDLFTEEMKERYDALNSKYGTGVLINLVRKIIPSMIAHDIAGIQPMSGPIGQVFTLNQRYSKSDKS